MKQRRAVLSGALVAGMLLAHLPPPARGSHGGPRFVRVLGYDDADQKVYFEKIHQDESAEGGGVWYFDLKGPEPTRAVRARSLDPVDYARDEPDPRVERLRDRLRSLSPGPVLHVGAKAVVAFEDSTSTEACRRRFGVDVTLESGGRATVRCTTYVSPRVVVAGVYPLPGFELVVIAYRGVPWEMCYEDQKAILVPQLGHTPVPRHD